MNQLNVVEFVRRCAAERTHTADSRGSCDKRSMRIASDYPARHSVASVPELVCFVFFLSWQTVAIKREIINKASPHSRRRQPGPLDSSLADHPLKIAQVDNSDFSAVEIISIPIAVSAVAVISHVFGAM